MKLESLWISSKYIFMRTKKETLNPIYIYLYNNFHFLSK